MKTLLPAWFILSGAASLAAFAAQSSKDSSREIIGRIPAEPDVVIEWNAAISDYFEEFSLASTQHIEARVYATVHLAMRDAIAATRREARHDTTGAMGRSAASTAAHDMLVALCPADVNRFAPLQARHIAASANDDTASHGRQIGQRIAASLLNRRAGDGWPLMRSRGTARKAETESRRETVTKPTPFSLKRAQQFEPEPPYLIHGDDVFVPNHRLQNNKLIGPPADVAPPERSVELWLTEPVVRWNRIAQLIAVLQPQDLSARARLFAALNTALADTLLSGTYWSDAYRNGRGGSPNLRALDAFHRALDAGNPPPESAALWWEANPLSGFPAVPSALAGAAETIFRSDFGGDIVFAVPANASDAGAQPDFTNLRSAARECAWAALIGGASTHEGCVAGYDLGSRIAAHVLKQDRR